MSWYNALLMGSDSANNGSGSGLMAILELIREEGW